MSTLELPLKISSEAEELIQVIISSKQIPENYYLRIGIKGGACMGEYFLAFDKVDDVEDLMYAFNNQKIIIAKKELMYLVGKAIEIDTDETGEKGLTFK